MKKGTDFLGVRLPDGTKIKLDKHAKESGFINTSEYVRDLLRAELEKVEAA